MRKIAYPLKSAALLLTLIAALLALAACANTANSRVAGSEREIIYGYLLEVNQQARTVMVDEAELLTPADTERISQLGLREDMFQDGYYVYNRAVERRLYALPDTAEVDLSALRQVGMTTENSRTDGLTDNMTNNKTDRMTDNTTNGTANGMTDNRTNDMTNGMTDNTTDNTASGMTDNTTNNTANGMTDNTTNNRTDRMTDNTANGMTGNTTESNTDRDTLGEDLRDAANTAASSIADLLDLQREHPEQLYALTIENNRVVAIRAADIAAAADNR